MYIRLVFFAQIPSYMIEKWEFILLRAFEQSWGFGSLTAVGFGLKLILVLKKS
jgi:hypothetical protein